MKLAPTGRTNLRAADRGDLLVPYTETKIGHSFIHIRLIRNWQTAIPTASQ